MGTCWFVLGGFSRDLLWEGVEEGKLWRSGGAYLEVGRQASLAPRKISWGEGVSGVAEGLRVEGGGGEGGRDEVGKGRGIL